MSEEGVFGISVAELEQQRLREYNMALNDRLDFLAHIMHPRVTAIEAIIDRHRDEERPLRPGRFPRTPNEAARRRR